MSKKQVRESSKRQAIREARRKKQQRERLTIVAIISLIAVTAIGLTLFVTFRPAGEFVIPTPIVHPNANFNSMGDPNAPVKMVEYSDFQCPFCKRFRDETLPRLIDEYIATNKVYFTYVPYGPTGQWIGPESEDSAKASFCAAEQGKFWDYHDILYANQTGENVGNFTSQRLMAFANALKLDMKAFRSCFNQDKYRARLIEGITQGIQKGIGGTPSFLVNDKKIEGAQPYEVFKAEIEAALAAAK